MAGILILGGAGGIGLALVDALVARGDTVGLTVLDEVQAEQIRSRHGNKVTAAIVDLNAAAAEPLLHDLASRFTTLDAVINCAGIAPSGPLEYCSVDAFRQILEINLVANLAIAKATLPFLRASRGRLVMISSMAGRVGLPHMGAYSASKHGLEGFADALRCEVRGQGVEVILVEPGLIRTPMVVEQLEANARQIEHLSAEADARYGSFYRGFQKTTSLANDGAGSSPQEIAEVLLGIIDADQPETRVVVGSDAAQLIQAAEALSDRDRDAMLTVFMS